jgi:hypothetical protein
MLMKGRMQTPIIVLQFVGPTENNLECFWESDRPFLNENLTTKYNSIEIHWQYFQCIMC